MSRRATKWKLPGNMWAHTGYLCFKSLRENWVSLSDDREDVAEITAIVYVS